VVIFLMKSASILPKNSVLNFNLLYAILANSNTKFLGRLIRRNNKPKIFITGVFYVMKSKNKQLLCGIEINMDK